MGATEEWITEVKVTFHVENDGPRYLRKGPETFTYESSLRKLVECHGASWIKDRIAKFADAIEKEVHEEWKREGERYQRKEKD